MINNLISNIKSFLFENKGLKQTIFKNTVWLMVAEVITRLLKLVLVIYAARILGVEDYGKFSFALAFIGLFVVFSDIGLSQIVVREFSKSRDSEKEFPAVLAFKTLLAFSTLFVMIVCSFFISIDPIIRKIIWILSVYGVINGFVEVLLSFFRSRQKMEYESIMKIAQSLIVNGLGFFVILNIPSIENLSYSYLFGSFFALFAILAFFHFKIAPLKLSWRTSIWIKYFKMSWPIALVGLFSTTYLNIDSTIMGYLNQIAETGWYNAAHKIILVTLIPADLIAISFFPTLSLAFKESREKLQNVWDHFNGFVMFLVVPMVVGGIALAEKIIIWVFDPTFSPAILAFQMLIIVTGISFVCSPLQRMLVACHKEKSIFWVYFAGAITNIILNIILIPRYSLYGASISLIFTYIVILLSLIFLNVKFNFVHIFNKKLFLIIINSSIATILMYLFITNQLLYDKFNALELVAMGLIVYGLMILFLIKITESMLWKRILKNKTNVF